MNEAYEDARVQRDQLMEEHRQSRSPLSFYEWLLARVDPGCAASRIDAEKKKAFKRFRKKK